MTKKSPRKARHASDATIVDVAGKSGVTRSTIPLILSNDPRCFSSRRTRALVRRAAKEVGYVRRHRKGEPTGRRLVGVIFPSGMQILESMQQHFAEQFLNRNECDVLLQAVDYSLCKEAGFHKEISLFDRIGVCGVLFMDSHPHPERTLGEIVPPGCEGLPIVGVDALIEGIDCTWLHRQAGVRRAIEYLFSLGHTDIAFVWAEIDNAYRDDRRPTQVFKSVRDVRKHFYDPDQPLLREHIDGVIEVYERAGTSPDAGAFLGGMSNCPEDIANIIVRELFRRREDRGMPTAIFVCSDTLAINIMTLLQLRGVRIPQDVSIMGYGDVPTATYVQPALTTVYIGSNRGGASAARFLLERMDGEAPQQHRHLAIPPEVVVRESTARPRASQQ